MEKLGLWQISQFRQKITGLIRKMCPDTHSRGRPSSISPAQSRKYQTDPTWQIVDGVTPVGDLAKITSPEHAAHSEDPDSTGRLVETTAEEIMVQVKEQALKQGQGFSDVATDIFVNEDGTINSTYVNSNGELVDATDVTPKVHCTS